MLVKFLSFCATVLGTARYKAIFLSCLVLVLSLTGISAVALMNNGQKTDGAASAVQGEEGESGTQELPSQIGAQAKPTKETATTPSSEASGQTTPADNTKKPADPAKPSATDIEIDADDAKIVLAPDSTGVTSRTITVASSDDSKLSWAVTGNQGHGLYVEPGKSTDPQAAFEFTLRTDSNTQKGDITLTITAKSANSSTPITKQITVTVQ